MTNFKINKIGSNNVVTIVLYVVLLHADVGKNLFGKKETCKMEMVRKIKSSTATIKIMDEFSRVDADGKHKYDALILDNDFLFMNNNQALRCQFVIKEFEDFQNSKHSITFTQLKTKKNKDFEKYIKTIVGEEITEPIGFGQKINIMFELPIYFAAQNSNDLSDFGWNWDWQDGIGVVTKYGSEYGQTLTPYYIVGVRIQLA